MGYCLHIKHGLTPTRNNMMLLPMGRTLNKDLVEAKIGTICTVEGSDDKVKIIGKMVVPLKGTNKGFSNVSDALALGIYGYGMSPIFEAMKKNSSRHMDDVSVLLLVVKKI